MFNNAKSSYTLPISHNRAAIAVSYDPDWLPALSGRRNIFQ